MKKVGGLIPVDPHTSKVITQEVVERISGKEGQAVWDPICLVWRVVEIGFSPPSQIAYCLCALLIRSGPNSERNAVKGVGGILLEDKRVVYAVRLAASSANFNVMRETSLYLN
jgi:hypothetical protein